MSTKRILTVGVELASDDIQYVEVTAKSSLLDWDIIIFKPDIGGFISTYHDEYQGKPSLDDGSSFQLKECCAHWRREIKQAVETGKTVLVFLPSLTEVYIATGSHSYSGTGRNQRVTRLVTLFSNYESIPAKLGPVVASGTSMKLSTTNTELLAPYWREFESISRYQVLLTEPKIPVCVTTRTGDKPVGAIYRSTASNGTLLCLPDIDFYPRNFIRGKDEKQSWTAAAAQFAGKFIASVVALDKTLRATSEVTPEPVWVTGPQFTLEPEAALRLQMLDAERQVEEAQRRKEEIAGALVSAGIYRRLLYEKGKPLEAVIIDALRLLGFTAAPFKESGSEFDVVFESDEGRLIGEAEGKDNKAVNIDKLRQLAMNIHEDLQRDEIKSPAKPVLFGNGFRLLVLAERSDPFTEKCHSAAATSSTALVFTADLFAPVQYLVMQQDADYARNCRLAILNTVGRVTFPKPPATSRPTEETREAETQ
jgi:hypothetical protein